MMTGFYREILNAMTERGPFIILLQEVSLTTHKIWGNRFPNLPWAER